MSFAFFVSLTLTGFSVALLHAAIFTHWLPFVIVGQSRGWSRARILGAVALAGGGHVLATTLIGIALARFGWAINEQYEEVFHWLVAALLVGLGAWLSFRAPHGRACEHCTGGGAVAEGTDRGALWGLFLTLTLSPCELFLPIYLTAAPYGWTYLAWLSGVLAVATLVGMMALTWLTLRGIARFRWIDRLSPRVFGCLLILLGATKLTLSHT